MASYLNDKVSTPTVLVGYDTRTGNSANLDDNSYTYTLVNALYHHGVVVHFCDHYTPAPVVSWAVRHNTYDMGIMITASQAAPNYNGIHIYDSSGASATSSVINTIETATNHFFDTTATRRPLKQPHSPERVDYSQAFYDHLVQTVQTVFQLPFPDFSLNCIIDTKCGSGIDLWKKITHHATGAIQWVNDSFSSNFNFELPNLTAETPLATLQKRCREQHCVGFLNDPDADCHMMIDETGDIVSTEKLTALIIDYCHQQGIPIESVSSTWSTSHLISAACDATRTTQHKTNVGFKHGTKHLKQSANKGLLSFGVGASEFSISHHTLSPCGFLPILIVLGIMKTRHQPLHELIQRIDTVFGTYWICNDTIDVKKPSIFPVWDTTLHLKENFEALFDSPIDTIHCQNGMKIMFKNNDWVLCEPSDTPSRIQICTESTSQIIARSYLNKMRIFLEDDRI